MLSDWIQRYESIMKVLLHFQHYFLERGDEQGSLETWFVKSLSVKATGLHRRN